MKTIQEIHEAFESGALSPVTLTQEYLQKSQATQTNAYLTVCAERALKQAEQAQAVLKKSGGKVPREATPLFGIPMAIKDNLVIEGVRTTCASKMLENYMPPYTATCVERLERAGAIVLGKTNLDEFAMGGSNENSAFGAVLHPTHPDRVPGGSSGGSATAVGADLCVASLGSDTGGSIRLPASFCGIVGYKPSYGRISRSGLIAFASSLDQVGPMAHSVEDVTQVYEAMTGRDPLDSTSGFDQKDSVSGRLKREPLSFEGLRVGVPKEYFVEGLDASVEKSVRGALKHLEKKGARLVPITLPHSKYSISIYYIIAVSEASSNLARFDGVRYGSRPADLSNLQSMDDFYKRVRALFGPEVKRRIILGTFALSAGYADAYYKRACQVRRLVKEDFDRAFREVDVIASPVSPTTAFKRGEQVADPLTMYLNDLFTIPANLAGLPAISVPCGKDADALPIGMQWMAGFGADAQLLRVAHAFEAECRAQGGF